jgi:hypothetical protein
MIEGLFARLAHAQHRAPWWFVWAAFLAAATPAEFIAAVAATEARLGL